jgi:hypothetical protein
MGANANILDTLTDLTSYILNKSRTMNFEYNFLSKYINSHAIYMLTTEAT